MDIQSAAASLQKFSGANLTEALARIESDLRGATLKKCSAVLASGREEKNTLAAAFALKRVAAQVNTAIHALGIILCLPHILKDDEVVDYVSLGAGNTGRTFDLETNFRVAEFKFIAWQGTAETIRQNSIFKDFFLLADNPVKKEKYLYVIDTKHPLKFFKAKRAITSVLSKNEAIRDKFRARFGDKYTRVYQYYEDHGHKVKIEDVSLWLPELISGGLEDVHEESSSLNNC
jgi:hypothetical protein